MFCHKHVLPCTFTQMALYIHERSLSFMHSCYCGKNLDIYVTIVNRSSNLSRMISQWICWSWNLHRLVPIYLPTLLFFCLKSSTNVNLKMKRDNELQKPSHILVFDWEKGKATFMKNVWCPKSQRLAHQIEISKIQASISKWDVLIQKDQMICFVWSQMKSFKIMYSSFVGGHICIFL